MYRRSYLLRSPVIVLIAYMIICLQVSRVHYVTRCEAPCRFRPDRPREYSSKIYIYSVTPLPFRPQYCTRRYIMFHAGRQYIVVCIGYAWKRVVQDCWRIRPRHFGYLGPCFAVRPRRRHNDGTCTAVVGVVGIGFYP